MLATCPELADQRLYIQVLELEAHTQCPSRPGLCRGSKAQYCAKASTPNGQDPKLTAPSPAATGGQAQLRRQKGGPKTKGRSPAGAYAPTMRVLM